MTWQLYQLTYELQSPLHIGYHKVGKVQRTRYYLPARNLWAAVTETLTRHSFALNDVPAGDYQKIGLWVQEHCAFTYFYLLEGDRLLTPGYLNGKLYYGDLPAPDFERRYLDSMVSTALEPRQAAAKSGSLHEVEFISPYPLDGGETYTRTRLRGYLFLDEQAQPLLGNEKWRERLGALQVGGERRYRFGQLRLLKILLQENGLPLKGCRFLNDAQRPRLQLERDAPLLAHTLTTHLSARGPIEPLVGRETKSSHAFGFELTRAQLCWAPGSIVEADVSVRICPSGIWEAENHGHHPTLAC